jgi:hypothetical protein
MSETKKEVAQIGFPPGDQPPDACTGAPAVSRACALGLR